MSLQESDDLYAMNIKSPITSSTTADYYGVDGEIKGAELANVS